MTLYGVEYSQKKEEKGVQNSRMTKLRQNSIHPKNPTSCFSKQNIPPHSDIRFIQSVGATRIRRSPLLRDYSSISKACKCKRARVKRRGSRCEFLDFRSSALPSIESPIPKAHGKSREIHGNIPPGVGVTGIECLPIVQRGLQFGQRRRGTFK